MSTRTKIKRIIKDRLIRQCADCGKTIRVIHYTDKSCRGGHYFGKVPICSKRENERMSKSGTHKSKVGSLVMDVFNYDPKPYKYVEWWECPTCYWGK